MKQLIPKAGATTQLLYPDHEQMIFEQTVELVSRKPHEEANDGTAPAYLQTRLIRAEIRQEISETITS